jgi:hypothetical protein
MEPRIDDLKARRRSGTVLLDRAVVADVARALDGRWRPDDEADPDRRALLVAAARLRIYADRDTVGWYLAAPPGVVHGSVGDAWAVAFLRDVATLDDAPPQPDVDGLASLYRESGLAAEAAEVLAWAVLSEPVVYLVATDRRAYRHSRDHDLPARLRIVEVGEAVDLLELVPGQRPDVAPAQGAVSGEWWIAD